MKGIVTAVTIAQTIPKNFSLLRVKPEILSCICTLHL
jgi:hypothetical protein